MNVDDQVRSEALPWLFEMELLNNPQTNNALILNILRSDYAISDVELVIDSTEKKMLIYVEYNTKSSLFRPGPTKKKFLDVSALITSKIKPLKATSPKLEALRKDEISSKIVEILSEVLPSYQFRVVFDTELLKKSLEILNKK